MIQDIFLENRIMLYLCLFQNHFSDEYTKSILPKVYKSYFTWHIYRHILDGYCLRLQTSMFLLSSTYICVSVVCMLNVGYDSSPISKRRNQIIQQDMGFCRLHMNNLNKA